MENKEIKKFETIKEFMRMINNASEELIIRGNHVYNKENQLVAEYHGQRKE